VRCSFALLWFPAMYVFILRMRLFT
jgi:hypothetical protein